jgi:hypothetical protein
MVHVVHIHVHDALHGSRGGVCRRFFRRGRVVVHLDPGTEGYDDAAWSVRVHLSEAVGLRCRGGILACGRVPVVLRMCVCVCVCVCI